MILVRLVVGFTLLVLSKWNVSLAEPMCFDADKVNLKFHLGTKTPYRFIFNRNDSMITYPGNKVLTFSVFFVCFMS